LLDGGIARVAGDGTATNAGSTTCDTGEMIRGGTAESAGAAESKNRYYRPDLDVIRFIAFLAVFCHHTFQDNPAHKSLQPVVMACGFGLSLFFTLSAYLITTLLLRERDKTQTVDLGRFYKRRMLRIWPLYFVALSGYMYLQHHQAGLGRTGVWYLAAFFMLGNLPGLTVGVGEHLWSISVEEQFYVVWPGLMKRLSIRQLVYCALGLVVLSNCVLAYYGLVHANTWNTVWWSSFVQMETFAAGILLALRDYVRPPTARSWPVRIVGLIAVFGTWVAAVVVFHIKGVDLPARGPVSLCIGFALVAASCAGMIDLMYGTRRWPKSLLYLGKISYGLYVFHILGLMYQGRHWHGALAALTTKIVLASLSYKFLESPFLRLKEKYEVVLSRPVN
jgi:peptidoglycan/LPS O-acetylase OafA/YrhL